MMLHGCVFWVMSKHVCVICLYQVSCVCLQAIAWTTAAHRFNRDSFQELPKEHNSDGVKGERLGF